MSLWRSVWTRLLVSHVVAGLLGVAAGVGYTTKVSSKETQTVLRGFKRQPLLDAATVAFRFGSPEHSRAALQSFLRIGASTQLEWGDTMLAEVRLAILDRELSSGRAQSPHLDAARAACRRLRGSDCAPEEIRALAMRLVHKRQ